MSDQTFSVNHNGTEDWEDVDGARGRVARDADGVVRFQFLSDAIVFGADVADAAEALLPGCLDEVPVQIIEHDSGGSHRVYGTVRDGSLTCSPGRWKAARS